MGDGQLLVASLRGNMLRDVQFLTRLKWLLEHHYGGRPKALAIDLQVDRSTVSRWLSEKVSPSKRDRAAVNQLYERKEAEEAERDDNKLRRSLKAKGSELLKRLILHASEQPRQDEPSDEIIDDLKEIIRRIRHDRFDFPTLLGQFWKVVVDIRNRILR